MAVAGGMRPAPGAAGLCPPRPALRTNLLLVLSNTHQHGPSLGERPAGYGTFKSDVGCIEIDASAFLRFLDPCVPFDQFGTALSPGRAKKKPASF